MPRLLGGLWRGLRIPFLALLRHSPTLYVAQHVLDPVLNHGRDPADLGVGTIEGDRIPDHEVHVSLEGLY